ncbi:MAG: thioredoxin-disulfide reductase [Alphaproteobacteria bacterium]|nr:thioredoxin-disulfide reductase [Alphaproteobacteria bacterium]
MAEYKTKVLIIGSGPAGYTAGIYAAHAGFKPILVSGSEIGGQLVWTETIKKFPSYIGTGHGQDLMETMRQQALEVGVTIVNDKISEVNFNRHPFICLSENHNCFSTETVIVATGASAKWLGLKNEDVFRGFGVSVCATCDGFFYRGKDVAVIGGGNTAVENALYLTGFAKSVTLIHRCDCLNAEQSLQDTLRHNLQVHIKYDTTVEEILGTENPPTVNGLKLKNIKTDKTETLKVDGVFIAIGHHPNTEIFKNKLALDRNDYIITKPGTCETNIDGVFAAGDVMNPEHRQAIIAAGSGATAAIEAERYLNR